MSNGNARAIHQAFRNNDQNQEDRVIRTEKGHFAGAPSAGGRTIKRPAKADLPGRNG
jgi:hypothetical protein